MDTTAEPTASEVLRALVVVLRDPGLEARSAVDGIRLDGDEVVGPTEIGIRGVGRLGHIEGTADDVGIAEEVAACLAGFVEGLTRGLDVVLTQLVRGEE
jgi:hypothetical protein